MQTTKSKDERVKKTRKIVYNASLLVGLMATVGISNLLGDAVVTSVYAKDDNSVSSVSIESEYTQADDTGPLMVRTKTVDIVQQADARSLLPLSIQDKTLEIPVNNEQSATPEETPVETPIEEQVETTVVTLEDKLNSTSSTEEYIWMYLTASEDEGGAGFTDAGAAAIMGCMQAESGLSTDAYNNTDGGFGILQWTDTQTSSRKSKLMVWCSDNGYSHETLDGQLKFAVHELKTVFSAESGYAFRVYETLKENGDIASCLKMFFSHAEAGTDVPISNTYWYAGHSTTQDMYDARLSNAWNYYYTFAN